VLEAESQFVIKRVGWTLNCWKGVGEGGGGADICSLDGMVGWDFHPIAFEEDGEGYLESLEYNGWRCFMTLSSSSP
jgi:hypothetical protein